MSQQHKLNEQQPVEAVNAEAHDYSKDLDFVVVKDPKDTDSAWNFKHIDFAHASLGDQIIANAKLLPEGILKTVGDDRTKPCIPAVHKLFQEALGVREAGSYIPVLEKIEQHAPGSIDALLKSKYTFEQSSHKSHNAFSLDSIKAGSGMEVARTNWNFAVNTFNESKQNAEATFKEAVYAARMAGKYEWEKTHSTLINEIIGHENHFKYSLRVAEAIDKYGKTMTSATAQLVSAYTRYLSELVKNWNNVAQGESTLLVANKKDALTLWTAIKTAYNAKPGASRG